MENRQEYKTVFFGGEDEIIEKKSRFIATVRQVSSEEEAIAFIEEMRKKYWNATHNCFAYVIGKHAQIQRCSDDGEPQGTAGKPMLDVLLGEEIKNAAVVVTRYFGGTLLGTGGLVRAYSKATQAGLQASCVITKTPGCRLNIRTDYTGFGKIQYVCGQRKLHIVDTQYTDEVLLSVLVPEEMLGKVESEITEKTNGQAKMERETFCYFAEVYKEIRIFED